MRLLPGYRALILAVMILPLTGCLFRSRKVERQMSTAPLKSATQQELIDYINTQAAKVQSMQAMGRNDIETHHTAPLENLRPQHIYDALLLREVDPQSEIAVMENDFEIVTDSKHHQVQQPDYQIEIIRKGEHGWFLSRKIVFGRTDLQPHRQLVYDQNGNLATDTRYEDYKTYNGTNFPSQIEIWRPQEEYDITMTIVKLQLNEPLPDDRFVLEQPPGAEVVHLDQPQASQTQGAKGGDSR